YMMAGMSTSFADSLGDIYIVKTDSHGDTLWTKSYGVNLNDAMNDAYSIRQTNDSGYIIAGVVESPSAGKFGILIKTDELGNIEWNKLYGTADTTSDGFFSSVEQTPDNGYIVTGYISN